MPAFGITATPTGEWRARALGRRRAWARRRWRRRRGRRARARRVTSHIAHAHAHVHPKQK
eukprot:scaffold87645_cov50-Phaeocystis_antarctica.AAC.3